MGSEQEDSKPITLGEFKVPTPAPRCLPAAATRGRPARRLHAFLPCPPWLPPPGAKAQVLPAVRGALHSPPVPSLPLLSPPCPSPFCSSLLSAAAPWASIAAPGPLHDPCLLSGQLHDTSPSTSPWPQLQWPRPSVLSPPQEVTVFVWVLSDRIGVCFFPPTKGVPWAGAESVCLSVWITGRGPSTQQVPSVWTERETRAAQPGQGGGPMTRSPLPARQMLGGGMDRAQAWPRGAWRLPEEISSSPPARESPGDSRAGPAQTGNPGHREGRGRVHTSCPAGSAGNAAATSLDTRTATAPGPGGAPSPSLAAPVVPREELARGPGRCPVPVILGLWEAEAGGSRPSQPWASSDD